MKLENLKTNYLAKNIIYYDVLDSTQELAREISKNNLPNGTIVIAKNQTNGKGTHGRRWESKDGKNATFTLILYPHCNIKKIENISIKIAETICKAMYEDYGVNLEIKAPNDIMLKGKKIGGILTQINTIGETVNELFIGIGFNVNQIKFSKELQGKATSLIINNISIKVTDIICTICNALEKELEILIEK